MRSRLVIIGLVVAVLVGGAGAAAWTLSNDRYRVSVMLGSATNLVEGGTVTLHGFKIGEIESISVQSGKAKVDLAIDPKQSPLHDGARVTVEWKAVLGERTIEISDGKSANPTIPDGGVIRGRQLKPVEIDQVLNALDKPTRERLASLVSRFQRTVSGNEEDIKRTLVSAGPALQRLGQVLEGLGSDGRAIQNLVHQLNEMVVTLAKRDDDVANVVSKMTQATSNVVGKRKQLDAALRRLPATLDTAKQTLDGVPEATEAVVPLLADLRPVTGKLRATAASLSPLLRDLRPMVEQLGPTLEAARTLLEYTPGLLDSAKATLPGITNVASYLEPVVNYLRPYTPEVAGWASTWASNAGNYDSNGHYIRFYAQQGASNLGENPGVVPPGVESNQYPMPGGNVNQPWTDAWGTGVR